VSFPRPRTLTFRLVALGLFLAAASLGRAALESRYSRTQVFQTAVRLVRVEHGYPISEKDEASGYFLFEYPVDGADHGTPGSVEVVEQDASVLLIVRVPALPEYHERRLAEAVLEKLKSDYGEPRPKAPQAPQKAKPDKATDENDAKEPPPPAGARKSAKSSP
jgi:hypothetical protein